MSDIKLFRLNSGVAVELQGDVADLEKPLQSLIERNLEPLLGIKFLASEYSTGKTHAGRIDSLGLDENSCPVILEYKRSVGENVINQGLFYLDWLMDHQAEFELLVMRKLGSVASEAIDWSAPRVVCIASDFTKYDAHAVQQIKRNIELIRYRLFGEELLLLEQASFASTSVSKSVVAKAALLHNDVPIVTSKNRSPDRSYAEWLLELPPLLADVLTSLENYIYSLADDVERKELRLYTAFKRLKNFTTVVLQKNRILVYVHLNPDQVVSLPANARDVRNIGHWGTGDIELSLADAKDLDAAKPLIQLAYEGRLK